MVSLEDAQFVVVHRYGKTHMWRVVKAPKYGILGSYLKVSYPNIKLVDKEGEPLCCWKLYLWPYRVKNRFLQLLLGKPSLQEFQYASEARTAAIDQSDVTLESVILAILNVVYGCPRWVRVVLMPLTGKLEDDLLSRTQSY